MRDLTTDEMRRLLIALADLPSVDLHGLAVETTEDWDHPIVMTRHPDAGLVRGYSANRGIWQDMDTRVWISMADRTSRNRIAESLAVKVGLAFGCSSPCWEHSQTSPGLWVLGAHVRAACPTAAPEDLDHKWGHRFKAEPHPFEGAPIGRRCHFIPALAEIDPTDDRRLPDGARWVDALALAIAAVHVLRGR